MRAIAGFDRRGAPSAARAILFAALLGLAAGCQRDANAVDPVVAAMAKSFRLAQRSSDVRLRGSRGEGRTLILEVEMSSDVPAVVGVRDIAPGFAQAICANPRTAHFFTEGRTLRVDLSVRGRAPTSAVIDRCTGPTGQGITIENYVRMYRAFVGRDLGDGARITAARAEGQTLVLDLDGPAGWRSGLTPAAIAQEFLEGFCESGTRNSFFAGGRTLRVDTTEGGRDPRQGQLITACPARPAAR
jgi:hypothetical protein